MNVELESNGGRYEEDPKELATRSALEQVAWREGYRSAEELAAHRPDLVDLFTAQALERFPSLPESPDQNLTKSE